MMIRFSVAMLLPFCLAACGSASDDDASGISASQASALNDAAAKLDDRMDEAGLNAATFNASSR